MTGQLRVALCCENYYPSVGGVQEVMRQLAERLAGLQLDVTVVTGIHPQRAKEVCINGVKVRSFAISGNLAKGLSGDVEAYQSFLVEQDFDALLIKAAQQWTFDAALDVLQQLPARKLFVPCGFSGLNEPLYKQYFQDMPRWLAMFDGLIFYATEYQDIEFARKCQLTKLHVISNGVDEREFASLSGKEIRLELGIPEHHDLVLSVGARIAAKGHWEVLRAFSKAQLRRPATLVINGNVPDFGWLALMRRFIKHTLSGRMPLRWEALRLGLWGRKDKRLKLVNLPREELCSLYAAADLFVFASHVEYSPLVIFEAAAAGAPVLVSSAGNSREIISWLGGGGVVLEANAESNAMVSADELATQMERMLADKQRLKDMGACNRRTVFEKGFTWEKIVLQYYRLLVPSVDKGK